MSEHDWTREQIAAFVLGGLTAEEMERLETHVRDCPDCAAAVAAFRRVDRGLDSLFADVRPGLGLEDDAIRSFRTAPRRRTLSAPLRLPRLAVAAGILLVLSIVGAMAGNLASNGWLPLPGQPVASRIQREAAAPVAMGNSDSMDAAGPAQPEAAVRGTSRIHSTDSRLGEPKSNDYRAKIGGVGFSGGGGISGGISGGINGGIGGGIAGGYTGMPGQPTYTGGTLATGDVTALGKKITIQNGGASPDTFFYSQSGAPLSSRPATGSGQPLNYGGQPSSVAAAPTATNTSAWFIPTEHRPESPGEAKEPELAKANNLARADPEKPPTVDEPASHRVVIRSGDMEFEVNSFDAAVATVTKLVAGLKGAFVATVNSDKLANGKVRGSITVRTPPEHLDSLVLDLRRDLGATGELKGMKIASQDVTKQYTDLESRLRAARAMEQRLLQMIKDGKGEIKQLLEAEKELGKWRTQIEEFEGEMRYYANLAALATLTISLTEKEIRAAAAVTESEQVQAGVEVEDVDKAYQQTLAAVAEAKGRVVKSELKQLAAGQFNASLQFDVPPEAAGPIRDRLRQLGRVARLEIDRAQHAAGGSTPADVKVKHGDTVFLVQLYNLSNVAAHETAILQVAAPDVRAAYQALRDAAAKAAARVLVAQLNEQDAQNITAEIDVEVRRGEDAAFRAALDAAGEVVSRQVTRAVEGDNATDTKVQYRATLLGVNRLSPRETTSLTLEVADVDQALAAFGGQVAEAKGRQLTAQSQRDRAGKVTAQASYEVPLAMAGLAERFKTAGAVRGYQSTRDPQAPAGKFATARIDVTLVSGDQIVAEGDGIWPQLPGGLSYSMAVLLTSVTWVVFGLCVVLPWGLVAFIGYRLFRRASRSPSPVAATPTTPA